MNHEGSFEYKCECKHTNTFRHMHNLSSQALPKGFGMDFTLELNLPDFSQQYRGLKPCQLSQCHSLSIHRQFTLWFKTSFRNAVYGGRSEEYFNIIMWCHVSTLMDWDRPWKDTFLQAAFRNHNIPHMYNSVRCLPEILKVAPEISYMYLWEGLKLRLYFFSPWAQL